MSFEPCETREGLNESFTSYLARLADAHGLTTWGLVTREFAPRFSRPLVDKLGHSDLFGRFGSALNGVADTALQGVQILGRLTGRKNLDKLTLLPLRSVLSPKSSVRAKLAWCPACFSDWIRDRRTIFWPLVWQLDVVKICPTHAGFFLVETCPNCRAGHFQLCRRMSPGYCPKCGIWLGVENVKYRDQRRGVTMLDQLVAQQCNELIQRSTTTPYRVKSSLVFRKNLQLILNHAFEGSVTAFSRAAQMHHNSLSDVVFGNARPGLDSILRLALSAGVRPTQLLSQPLSLKDVVQKTMYPLICVFERRTCRKYDWSWIARVLRRELDDPGKDFPNSLFSLCRFHGLDSGYVAVRLKASAETLIARRRMAVSKRRHERENAEAADLRRMVRHCFATGLWPSNRTLRALVKAPGSLRNPQIERERRRVIAEVLTVLEHKGKIPESPAGLCRKKGCF